MGTRPARPKGPDTLHGGPPLPPLQQALQLGLEFTNGLQGPEADVQTLPLSQGHVELLQNPDQLRATLQQIGHLCREKQHWCDLMEHGGM